MEWLFETVPEAKIVDLLILKINFDAPNEVFEYVRKNWFKSNLKKPFQKSEIYVKYANSSASSLSSSL